MQVGYQATPKELIVNTVDIDNRSFVLDPVQKYNISIKKEGYQVILDYGGTEAYKKVYITEKTVSVLKDVTCRMLITLFDEAHDVGNHSKQDEWFLEHMSELDRSQ